LKGQAVTCMDAAGVAKLTDDDFVSIAAYLSSRTP
jgi:cytochrome c553